MKPRNLTFHLLAFLTVIIWGVTFVSTKVLISAGLTPTWIFICRFVIAYLCVVCISHRPWFAKSIRDEMKMMLLGLTGGSLYFITENTALEYTFASNVSLIICAAPVLTLFFGAIYFKSRISLKAIVGSIVAIVGVGMIVYNGAFNLGINPLGDILTLLAALFWSIYCILLMQMSKRYNNLFITRKVFFYGFMTALVFMLFEKKPTFIIGENGVAVILNLLFLGIVASFLCYLMWNQCVKILGPQTTSNYIYFVPMVTILISSYILHEPITLWMLLGGVTIIFGVYLTSK